MLIASGAAAHAQTGLVERSRLEGEGIKPEASFEHRIDPWSRWTLKLQADPALGTDAGARAGIDVRVLTERLDAHELQAGAAMAFSPAPSEAVQAWQPFDDDRPTVFLEDSWRWSPQVRVTGGARLVGMPGGAALHRRLSLAWQPASDWTLRLTDAVLRPASPAADGLRGQRFLGMDLQTEQEASILRVQVRLASQLVNEAVQPQWLHAASLALSAPLDDRWLLGGDSLITSQGKLMRLKLSGSMVRDRARLSLVVPRRFQGRPIDPALNGGLPLGDADDRLGWRTRLELRF
ncbi:hypothetical protein DZC73_21825 [Albitalea terrae]|uniref:Uncharacterized protein n=1 Tax=Piscinibacter terrae TaxID=2496871 RepID=A0A3N7ITY8_9BURK|nr:hypothetical protein DZC73_21825 [Albitalea terrae]